MKTIDVIDILNVGDVTMCFDELSNQCYSTTLDESLYYEILESKFLSLECLALLDIWIFVKLKENVASEFKHTLKEYKGVAFLEREKEDVIYREYYLVY